MIKLIATDIDGTLIKSGHCNLDPQYFEVIEKLTRKGITFVAASGRQVDSIEKAFEPVIDKIYIVSNNGALVLKNSEILHSVAIPAEMIPKISETLRAAGPMDVTLAGSRCLYCYPDISDELYDYATNGYGFHVSPFNSYDELPEIYKICTYRSGNYPHPALKVRGMFPGIALNVADNEWVDLGPDTVSKGAALREIQQMLGIKKEETISFGDQENDIEMFKASGESFAVENASDIARAAASAIIPSYEKLGVLQKLKEYL